ncbi:MAG: hypothetical protein GY854_30085 [Deltaproteobacteria bacterium]|nr:hypothetical protein [Deltaproteobacteria bacterium]
MTKFSSAILEKPEDQELSRDELLHEKLSPLDTLEMTATELFTEARKDGWDEWLLDLSLADLDRIINLPAPQKKLPPSTVSKKRPKSPVRQEAPDECELESDEKSAASAENELHLMILSFLRDNPWTITADIMLAIERPDQDAQDALATLLKKDWLKTVGNNASTRYALA